MNIGQLMRGMLGEAAAAETRALELKSGQVVRGVVLQVKDNNEALVNINGVQVRAKLEMPLKAGQAAMLQVQPESTGSLLVLKSVDPGELGMLDDTFRDYAKRLGLPDQRWALEIVKDLRKEGFPFNRTTAAAFQQAAAAMPNGADAERWMQAAAAAFKRGLPMTAATIASMAQVMFGREVHELLDNLQRQLAAQPQPSAAEGADGAFRQTAAKVQTLLAQGGALLQGALGQVRETGVGPSMAPAGASAGAGPSMVPAGASAGAGPSMASAGASAAADAAPAIGGHVPPAVSSQTGAASPNWLGQMMKWLGVDHELQLARAASANGLAPAAEPAKAAGPGRGESGGPPAEAPRAGAATGAMPEATAKASSEALRADAAGVPPTATRLTAEASHAVPAGTSAETSRGAGAAGDNASRAAAPGQSAAGAAQPEAERSGDDNAAAVRARAAIGTEPGGDLRAAAQRQLTAALGMHAAAGLQAEAGAPEPGNVAAGQGTAASLQQYETLKSALMTLAGGSDTPPAIRETAQQLIHHITGQQLLLSPERNSSLFTHVTLFVPLKDQEGGGTASIHIQTRRGRKGELDADNCRLLFNLSMTTLGDTLVDVNITDKIVSLNLWNDHPAIGELVESSRGEIAERLQEAGYQLLSLRSIPLPKEEQTEEAVGGMAFKRQAPPDLSQFASTRYKGVDYRI